MAAVAPGADDSPDFLISLDDIDEQTTVVRDAISEISAQAQSVASAGLAETQSRRLRAQISDVEQRLVSAAAAERAAARSRARSSSSGWK